MGKLKQLQAQGVSDIHSYLIGRQDQRKDIIDMISQALNKPELELEKLPARMALAVIIGAITWNGEVEEKETGEPR